MEITVPPLGAEFTLGGAVFEFVGPVSDWGGDVNDSSLVLRLDYGGDSFLFTGDIGSGPLEDCAYVGGYDLDCDVLKLGHHGSSTSTDQGILDLTTPEVAVASCGLDNSYGHPHDEVVALCEENGVLLLRTDRDGDITLHSDGAEITRVARPDPPERAKARRTAGPAGFSLSIGGTGPPRPPRRCPPRPRHDGEEGHVLHVLLAYVEHGRRR